jgi:transcription termination factor Rho
MATTTPEKYTNFRVNASQYLGLSYQEYCNDLYAMAISNPEAYFKMRKEVLKAVKQDAIGKMYDVFYDILVNGTVNNAHVLNNGTDDLEPQYPEQKVSEIALSASNTLDNILNRVIELILPIDYKDIALKRIGERAQSKTPTTTLAPGP